MGSFAFTCCVSGLPIEVGDNVMWLLLTESKYDSAQPCYIHDRYFPRTFPVRAVYNDYGSIEKYDEKSPAVWSVVEGLKKDMIEVGVGDNSCHDVATKRGMSFAATLEAIWEGRLYVPQYVPLAHAQLHKDLTENIKVVDKVDPGVPNLGTVTQLIKDAGYVVREPDTEGKSDFLVDEVSYGWVRIRGANYNDKYLKTCLAHVQERFAAMITVGTGSYSSHSEIQVMPHPAGCKDRVVGFRPGEDVNNNSKLRLCQGMIREDVWNVLVSMTIPNWADSKKIHTIEEYSIDAINTWKARIKEAKDHAKLLASLETADEETKALFRQSAFQRLFGLEHDSYTATDVERVVSGFSGGGPYGTGLAAHFKLILQHHMTTPFTKTQITKFVDDWACFTFAQLVLANARYMWRPSAPNGPQFGEYKLHAELLESFADVAKVKYAEQEADRYA